MRRSELRRRQADAALRSIRQICCAASAEASTLATDLSALAAVSSELGHHLRGRRENYERSQEEREDVRRMQGRGIHVQGKSPGAASSAIEDDDEDADHNRGPAPPCDLCHRSRALALELVEGSLAACDHVERTTRAVLDVAAAVERRSDDDEEDDGGDGGGGGHA